MKFPSFRTDNALSILSIIDLFSSFVLYMLKILDFYSEVSQDNVRNQGDKHSGNLKSLIPLIDRPLIKSM